MDPRVAVADSPAHVAWFSSPVSDFPARRLHRVLISELCLDQLEEGGKSGINSFSS